MNAVTPITPEQPADTVEHTWDQDTLAQVDNYAAVVADVSKRRKALNDELAASKSALVAIGMNKDALAAANSYARTPEDERRNWDQTYIFARRALGCPLQEDLFVASMQSSVTVEAPAGKEE